MPPFVNTPAATLNFTFQDDSLSTATTSINVPFATSTTAALAAAEGVRVALGALSDAVIIAQSLTYSYTDTNAGDPVANSRVEEKGQLVWRTSNGRSTQFTIPAIKDSVLTKEGAIDRTNPLILALIGAVVLVDPLFCGADGSDIRSLIKAYQRFNSSTKRRLPSGR